LEEKIAIRKVDSSKKAKMKEVLPDEDILGDTIGIALTRFSGSAREVTKKWVTTKESKLI
jgi:hypothetical protein